ncbi:threonine/serine dehydratase [Opitutus sp. ER46]|uniref:threonine/serine dehydratase n=1 Tax=Opitutus sp. ER46 TaxID=2161864 RepID=UPI000D2F4D20|nr:threonine/serine dehydratase [Opitutus sp. ER46]PTX91348.1 threonine ammonia-lyase [Opitutus sp. ER46]
MKTTATAALSLEDFAAARRRLATGLRVTPCHIAPALTQSLGMRIWLKREDLHRTGSFKERGARNALLSLSEDQRAAGVVAASAGNHALGLAFHGAQLGVPVTVVMPSGAPDVKISRCRALGASVLLHGASFDASQTHAAALAASTGATLVHPFDDPNVIAGQGTLALEVLQQVPDVDTIVVPVGGGGLLAGVATVIKALRPRCRVIAVEPEHAAGFLAAQICGRPVRAEVAPTLADGLAVAQVGERTFAAAAQRVDDVVTVSEDEIARAIAALARQAGAVVEGAGASALAAVLAGKVRGRSVVLPLTGRNIDRRVFERVLAEHPEATRNLDYAHAA